jgi:hypothetical protein
LRVTDHQRLIKPKQITAAISDAGRYITVATAFQARVQQVVVFFFNLDNHRGGFGTARRRTDTNVLVQRGIEQMLTRRRQYLPVETLAETQTAEFEQQFAAAGLVTFELKFANAAAAQCSTVIGLSQGRVQRQKRKDHI